MVDLALELEIARRNARFRAWKGIFGVPFEGYWKTESGRAFFHSFCAHKCAYGTGDWVDKKHFAPLGVAVALRTVELKVIATTVINGPCPHLVPLLSLDPPEVQALTELELVAGEGGHHG